MEPLLSGDSALYLPYLVAVSGVCLWVYWSSTDNDLQCRRFIILSLCFALWLESSGTAWAAQRATATAESFPTITRTIEGVPVQLPDWSKISLDSLGGMLESGNVTIPSALAGELGFDRMSWNAGDKLSDVLPTGALSECLGLDKLTQGAIDRITGNVSNGLPLNDFKPVGLQNLSSLTEAVPGLGSQRVGNVAPVKDLIEKAIGSGMDIPGLSDLIGQLENSTQLLDLSGNVLGTLQNGNVVDATGNVIGALGAGKITNSLGEVTGMVNQAGQIVNQAGQMLGSVRSVIQSPQSLLQMPIGQLLQQIPQLGQLGMNNLNLRRYTFNQIPGLENAPIGRFQNWQQVLISGIPGLSRVPFNQFPVPMVEATNAFVARVDVPLDQKEQKHTNQKTVSGSYQQGFRVPCESNCAQAELTPIVGSQMDKANMGAFANGKSWISGKHQQVGGGEGVLRAVNGGQEPTGRNPYCSVFKQVITKVDAPGGKIGTSMYFRFCKRNPVDLGCTPYFLGPIPFLSYQEKAFIYLGAANPKDDGGGIQLPNQENDPLSAQDGFEPGCGKTLSGDAVNRAISTSRSPGRAGRYMGLVMAALKDQGITDPAQVAYALATAEHETDGFNTMFEYADGSQYEGWCSDLGNCSAGDGRRYRGRGFVQLTGRANYARMGQVFGVDLVNNPDLAAQPELAARIFAYGVRNGSYTGRRLSDYINGQRVDFYNARRVINGTDRAGDIAGDAQRFYRAISTTLADAKTNEGNCNQPTETNPCPPGQKCPLQNPLPGGAITSRFGYRASFGRMHYGIDLSWGGGARVLAADDGRVNEFIPVGGTCGGVISIKHPQRNLETRYLHMKRLLVSRGQPIKRGQPIGIEGNETPGVCSFGDHLHYEIYPGRGGAVNPLNYEHQPPLGR